MLMLYTPVMSMREFEDQRAGIKKDIVKVEGQIAELLNRAA